MLHTITVENWLWQFAVAYFVMQGTSNANAGSVTINCNMAVLLAVLTMRDLCIVEFFNFYVDV